MTEAAKHRLCNILHVEQAERLRAAIKQYALEWGDFILVSGDRSDHIFDIKKVSMRVGAAELIGEAINNVAHLANCTLLAGIETGGIPLVGAATGNRTPWVTSGFYVRKMPKGHGTNNKVDGLSAAEIEHHAKSRTAILMIEDVTTTGKSVLKEVEYLRNERGLYVHDVCTIVDRSEGRARALFEANDLQFTALFEARELLDVAA